MGTEVMPHHWKPRLRRLKEGISLMVRRDGQVSPPSLTTMLSGQKTCQITTMSKASSSPKARKACQLQLSKTNTHYLWFTTQILNMTRYLFRLTTICIERRVLRLELMLFLRSRDSRLPGSRLVSLQAPMRQLSNTA